MCYCYLAQIYKSGLLYYLPNKKIAVHTKKHQPPYLFSKWIVWKMQNRKPVLYNRSIPVCILQRHAENGFTVTLLSYKACKIFSYNVHQNATTYHFTTSSINTSTFCGKFLVRYTVLVLLFTCLLALKLLWITHSERLNDGVESSSEVKW